MQFLSVTLILDLHKMLIDRFGGIKGVRDRGLLESALAYPELLYSIAMERDVYVLGAAYGYHLIHNHAFVDGNKRIGVLAMLTFLRNNGITVRPSKDELYALAMK